MKQVIRTAERTSHQDLSQNYVYQRSLLAYVEAADRVSGEVLEIGTGSGYGIEVIAPRTDKFVTVDKFKAEVLTEDNLLDHPNVEFKQITVPPLSGIADESFDYVITFQVVEHIEDDHTFIREIHRVLKKGGKLIITTPNSKMSLTRNPWHVREYTVQEFKDLLSISFPFVEALGVFGNEKIMAYYEKNKASVKRITRFDIFNLQYRLPRKWLQVPYDILNMWNRKKLLDNNFHLVSDITMEDYQITAADDTCFDLFYIATK